MRAPAILRLGDIVVEHGHRLRVDAVRAAYAVPSAELAERAVERAELGEPGTVPMRRYHQVHVVDETTGHRRWIYDAATCERLAELALEQRGAS